MTRRIPQETLVLLASLYEEYELAEDPTLPNVLRAKLVFDNECRQLQEQEPANIQKSMTLEVYQACVVIPEILQYFRSVNLRPSV